MRLVTIARPGGSDPGVYFGEEILNFVGCREFIQAAHLLPASLRGIFEGGTDGIDMARRVLDRVGGSDSLAQDLRATGALTKAATTHLRAPLHDTSMILSVGQNYHGHLKEMNNVNPERPNGFTKNLAGVIGPNEAIVLPASHPTMVDWEGEFSIVIGRPCHNVSAAEAFDYIAGYTIINDVSARDWVPATTRQTTSIGAVRAWDDNRLGKQFPTFCPMGPVVATKDEIPDPDNLHLVTTLNGQIMQDTNTNDLIFGVAALIERFSAFFQFRPGDVISVGCPGGVGYGRDPKVFMKAGDVIEVTVDGVGPLRNPIVAAA